MADRYYISEVVGSGNVMDPWPWTRNQGPFRAALTDIVRGQGEIIKHQATAVLERGKFAIVNVSSVDFLEVDAYRGPFNDYNPPDSLLDVSLDSNMTSQHKTIFGNLLKKWLGMNNSQANAVVNSVTTYRQAFDYLVKQLDANANVENIRARAV